MQISATWRIAIVLALIAGHCRAADLANLPPNTWVPLKFSVDPLLGAGPDEKGQWAADGWNRLVYDSVGKRVLFYDRWHDKKHGGYTIYGNCLFAFDPALGKVTPIKVDNWTKVDVSGGQRTVELPENTKEPTPCPRHVMAAFDFAPEINAVFLCTGANASATKGDKLIGCELCDDTWRLDIDKKTWTQVKSAQQPKFIAYGAMAYCADAKVLVFLEKQQLWIMDLSSGQWRKSKAIVPTGGFGQTLAYDSLRKRVLVNGGTTYGFDVPPPPEGRKDNTCQKLYAFDPKTETIAALADCPTAQWAVPLAYDSKHDVFLLANVMKDKEKEKEYPSGTFCYDPKKNTWQTLKTANPTPASGSWAGWIRLCYDSEHGCFIGWVHNAETYTEEFYAFRYVPENYPVSQAK